MNIVGRKHPSDLTQFKTGTVIATPVNSIKNDMLVKVVKIILMFKVNTYECESFQCVMIYY